MKSLILITATRALLPLLLMFSIFMLLRGHNLPGGGFIGGVIAAAAYALYALANGRDAARRALRLQPIRIITIGIAIAVFSGCLALMVGLPFMTGLWSPYPIPGIGKVGTPLLFDMGVYLAVLGVMLTIILNLLEE